MGINPLVLIGLACVIAAIVGGGLKLLGIEIAVLTSIRRQVLLGAVGVALVAGVGIAGLLESSPPSAAGGDGEPTFAPGTPACYGQFFERLPEDRIASLEEGIQDSDVIRQDQPKDEPVGLMLTENGEHLGALRFRFFPAGNGLFKIDAVVDAQCRKVDAYSNASRPGSAKGVLQNFDALRVQLGDQSYLAGFGGGDTIRMDFIREA